MTGKNGNCLHCKKITRFDLHMQLFQNDSEHFVWVCSECRTRNPDRSKNFFIDSELVRKHVSPEKIERLPVIMPDLSNRCAVCGSRGAELHHWAPTGIFGKESGDWPKDYLCKEHHDLWHLMVTPQLVKEEYK